VKRRIIRQGHNTLTIPLPSLWAKELHLEAGHEVDVIEREDGLFVSAQKGESFSKKELDIKGMDIPTIWKYMMSVYREGFDEVKVYFDPKVRYYHPFRYFISYNIDPRYAIDAKSFTASEILQKIAPRFIGYEVIEQDASSCIIKDMAEPSPKQFESSLRRIFFLLTQMGKEICLAVNEGDGLLLDRTHELDSSVDKFHDFCSRVLNKTHYHDPKKAHLMLTTLFLLELLGDEFKHVAYHLKRNFNEKTRSSLGTLAQATLEQLQSYHHLFYNFDREKIMALSRQDLDMHFSLPSSQRKGITGARYPEAASEVAHHFRRIGRYINSLIEVRIEMECA